MKNLTVYVGTIKRCINFKSYKKDGDSKFLPEMTTSKTKIGIIETNAKVINDQAILIKTKSNKFYQFRLNKAFWDSLKIIWDNPIFAIESEPKHNDDIFYEEEALVPYYDDQLKEIKLRKLKKDLLYDPRIKSGIEH